MSVTSWPLSFVLGIALATSSLMLAIHYAMCDNHAASAGWGCSFFLVMAGLSRMVSQ